MLSFQTLDIESREGVKLTHVESNTSSLKQPNQSSLVPQSGVKPKLSELSVPPKSTLTTLTDEYLRLPSPPVSPKPRYRRFVITLVTGRILIIIIDFVANTLSWNLSKFQNVRPQATQTIIILCLTIEFKIYIFSQNCLKHVKERINNYFNNVANLP